MYLIKTPRFVQNLLPNYVWRIPVSTKTVFLTFDDGPHPEITTWVMDQLEQYDAHATFFCVGQNIERYPEVFQELIKRNHTVGSHTHEHLNGWNSDDLPYFHNVRRGAFLANSDLFRPPYGRIKKSQAKFLQRHYRIVMWDVLSGDFDDNLDGQRCAENVIRNVRPGSIVVFHDSVKARKNMQEALPVVLEALAKEGYSFEALTNRTVIKRKSA